jgi:hypothetical protein
MTGRGLGYCAGYDRPGFANPGPGFLGLGRGAGFRGGGHGFRNQYYATGLTGWQRAQRGMQAWGAAPVARGTLQPTPSDASALADLQARADRLEKELADVRQQLKQAAE